MYMAFNFTWTELYTGTAMTDAWTGLSGAITDFIQLLLTWSMSLYDFIIAYLGTGWVIWALLALGFIGFLIYKVRSYLSLNR